MNENNGVIDNIKKDYLEARKKRNKELTSIYSILLKDIEMVGKDNGNRSTTDQEAIQIIKKYIANLEKNIELLKENEHELANLNRIQEYRFEKHVLEQYLPKQLSKTEIIDIINDLKKNDNIKNIGQIFSYFKKNYAGQYDGELVSKLSKQLI